jgi:hypothetical protein
MAAEGPRLGLRKLALPDAVVPGALAGTGDGGLLVVDLAAHTVLRLDSRGAVASRFEPGVAVTGVAAAPGGGYVAAVAATAEIRAFGADGSLRDTFDVPGAGPVPAWPVGVVVEPGGNVLVVDRHNHRIVRLSPEGTIIGVGARGGWEPGLLRFPADLTRLPDGRVVVADLGNGRIQAFAPVAETRQ